MQKLLKENDDDDSDEPDEDSSDVDSNLISSENLNTLDDFH